MDGVGGCDSDCASDALVETVSKTVRPAETGERWFMILTTTLFLQVLALVLLLLAGFNCPCPPRFNLGWFGMFFWLLSLVVR